MPKKKNTKKEGGFPLLKFAVSAALASYAGYFYFTHKEEVDKETKKRIEELAKAFKESRKKVEDRVEQIWGDVNEEAVAKYMDIKGYLLHAIEEEELKKTGKMLKNKYDKLVDEVLATAKKNGLVDAKAHKKAAELLKMDWEEVEKVIVKLTKEAKDKMNEVKAMKKGCCGSADCCGKKKTVKKKVSKPVKKASKPAKKPAKKTSAKSKKK